MSETTASEAMMGLIEMLSTSPPSAGDGLRLACQASAQKAVDEVLDVIFRGARPENGIVRLRYTEFSEGVIRRVVRDAIDNCCD